MEILYVILLRIYRYNRNIYSGLVLLFVCCRCFLEFFFFLLFVVLCLFFVVVLLLLLFLLYCWEFYRRHNPQLSFNQQVIQCLVTSALSPPCVILPDPGILDVTVFTHNSNSDLRRPSINLTIKLNCNDFISSCMKSLGISVSLECDVQLSSISMQC